MGMTEGQADNVIRLLERIANSMEATAQSQYIIADRLTRLVQIEEKRWGLTQAGVTPERMAQADPNNYSKEF